MSHEELSPWMCHVCDRKFNAGDAVVCSVCFKTTCTLHLKRVPTENEAGILLLEPICVYCEMENMV